VRALLDTHAFLWWASGATEYSAAGRAVLSDPQNEILVSAASAWEIAIKVSLGKLKLPTTPERYLPDRLRRHGMLALPIELAHALRVSRLPSIHADPFDRLLVAQAQVEGVPIITADPAIARYDVDVIW
jgi:PIN domain nuclease of toxin-antitoxin system